MVRHSGLSPEAAVESTTNAVVVADVGAEATGRICKANVQFGRAVGSMVLPEDVAADLLGDAPEWQERALCAQSDPEAFFPEKGGSTREAKRICGRCDVKAECLDYALGHNEPYGIWGGLSERERRKLKR